MFSQPRSNSEFPETAALFTAIQKAESEMCTPLSSEFVASLRRLISETSDSCLQEFIDRAKASVDRDNVQPQYATSLDRAELYVWLERLSSNTLQWEEFVRVLKNRNPREGRAFEHFWSHRALSVDDAFPLVKNDFDTAWKKGDSYQPPQKTEFVSLLHKAELLIAARLMQMQAIDVCQECTDTQR